jgi:hypothetical protein
MADSFFSLDREARIRIRVMLWIGFLLLSLTAAFTIFDEVSFAFFCGVILSAGAFLLSERGERWLSRRTRGPEITTPGTAIDLSSLAPRLRRLRTDYLALQPPPRGPFHEVLIASAGAAIRQRNFFLRRESPLEEDQPPGEESTEPT